MVESIAQSLESIIILLLISVLMGVWIQSGVVPAMIYYGLKVMAPSIFLPCAMVITSAVSMVVGSWGSAGTLGLALMGISQALGIPAPLTAGAIISGAYVGDQLSPLSDSTNLTGAVIGVSVFEHVRFLSPVAGCSYLLALTGYFLAGLHYRSGTAETIAENTGAFLSSISSAFSLSPLLFLPMILLIFCILRRVPAILGISAGILSAGVLGALMQGSGLSALMRAAKEGYAGTTGNSMVDRLLTAGGLDAMMPSISLIIIAMMFGGILEKSGQMQALTAPVMRLVHSLTGLTGAVVLTSILSNITMPDQYVAVALPGGCSEANTTGRASTAESWGSPFRAARSLPRHWCRGTPAAASWRECWGFRPSPMHSMPFLTFPCRYWPCWPWRQPPARDGFYSNKEVKQHDEADRSRADAAAGNGTAGTAARCAPARPDNAGAGLWVMRLTAAGLSTSGMAAWPG